MSDADDTELGPSKSQRKRDAHAIKDLGETLVNLDPGQLSKFDLPEFIVDIINETRRIKKHGARKRQLQYLAKQLRQLDTVPLRQQLEQLQQPHHQEVAHLHRIEQWRDRLLQQGQQALTDFLTQYPQADRQHLRQLVRNAQQESQQQTAPKSARQLFKYVRELLELAED
jgi:ribosome-associated protein